MSRIDGGIYKLVPFFQHGYVIYAKEKKISSNKQEVLSYMAVEHFPLI